jgi:hypothetical protein
MNFEDERKLDFIMDINGLGVLIGRRSRNTNDYAARHRGKTSTQPHRQQARRQRRALTVPRNLRWWFLR